MSQPSLNLIIIRHGKAESMASSDLLRPLAPRGIRQSLGLAPNLPTPGEDSLALISPALRTTQTAACLLKGWKLSEWPNAQIVPWGHLAPAHLWQSAAETTASDVSSLYVIGHNPGLTDWAEALLGEAPGSRFLATAEAAHLQFDLPHWRYLGAGTGTLVDWISRTP